MVWDLIYASLLGIILDIGGGPGGTYLGARYWYDPGAFNNGFKGLCSVFATAAFAFSGTELVGLASAETANPRKSIPTAVKQIFWRVTLVSSATWTLESWYHKSNSCFSSISCPSYLLDS